MKKERNKKYIKEEKNYSTINSIIYFFTLILLIIITIYVVFMSVNPYYAKHKDTLNLIKRQFDKENKMTIIQSVKNTPNKDKDNILEKYSEIKYQKPMVLIFYKINCEKCEEKYIKTNKEIEKAKKKNLNVLTNIKYINVESRVGRELVKKYKITKVPQIIQIDKDNKIKNIYKNNEKDIEKAFQNILKEI